MMTTNTFAGVSPLLLFVAKATLVLVAALLGASALRRGTAGARHLVWLAALVGVLALPLLARIPSLHLEILPSTIGGTSMTAPDSTPTVFVPTSGRAPRVITYDAADGRILSTGSGSPPATPLSSPAPAPDSILPTLLIAWAGVALSLMGWLVGGAVQVRRIVTRSRELSSADWTTPLCEVADRLDLETAPRLLISDDIEMAFACRATEPTIVLPGIAESWTDDRRRAVLFHELAHVKRHDLLGHTLGRVACALYWFHPLVWTAARKLRAESERACDDLVLSCGARPSEYAQHLLDMVTSVRHAGAPVMAMPMARKKEFEGRMLAILDPAIRRASPGRVQAAFVVTSLGVVSLTIAAVAPARAAKVDRPEATHVARTPSDTPDAPARQRPSDPRPQSRPDAVVEAVARAGAAPAAGEVDDAIRHKQLSFGDAFDKFGASVGAAAINYLQSNLRPHGRGTDTARVSLLIKVLRSDTDASVRTSAAWALRDAPTAGARDALVEALSHDADAKVREMSAWALTEFESESVAGALSTAVLHDRDAHVRTTSAWALGQFDRSGSKDALISAVTDPDESVREATIWALGQHDLSSAPMSVINALTDQSVAVRTVAAWTLGRVEDSAAVRPLARAFETETESGVRVAELWAMTRIGQAPTAVIETAMKSSDPELRRRAVSMLAGNESPWPWPWPWPWPRPSP
ncbi:MAG TPA: HEAT repeat domain-containing protein [Gemmatimonadaceae bacterium]|nr:HEAT repeat domain-containing protein [Gemmatimonadaceae bacterium]